MWATRERERERVVKSVVTLIDNCCYKNGTLLITCFSIFFHFPYNHHIFTWTWIKRALTVRMLIFIKLCLIFCRWILFHALNMCWSRNSVSDNNKKSFYGFLLILKIMIIHFNRHFYMFAYSYLYLKTLERYAIESHRNTQKKKQKKKKRERMIKLWLKLENIILFIHIHKRLNFITVKKFQFTPSKLIDIKMKTPERAGLCV